MPLIFARTAAGSSLTLEYGIARYLPSRIVAGVLAAEAIQYTGPVGAEPNGHQADIPGDKTDVPALDIEGLHVPPPTPTQYPMFPGLPVGSSIYKVLREVSFGTHNEAAVLNVTERSVVDSAACASALAAIAA